MGEICGVCFQGSSLLLRSNLDGKMLCEDCFHRERLGVPRNEYSSGNRDDECWARIYGRTKEEAEEKKRKYFASYPARGYNTHIYSEGWLNGYYYILIDRWHSCD